MADVAQPDGAAPLPASPAVTWIDPPSEPDDENSTITLTGINIGAATEVTFGGRPATQIKPAGPNQITVQAPAGSGTSVVRVKTPAGASGLRHRA